MPNNTWHCLSLSSGELYTKLERPPGCYFTLDKETDLRSCKIFEHLSREKTSGIYS